jgi:copper(I)-binding protein
MGLSDAWTDGAAIPLTLVFEQAGEIAVELPVVIGAPAAHRHDD